MTITGDSELCIYASCEPHQRSSWACSMFYPQTHQVRSTGSDSLQGLFLTEPRARNLATLLHPLHPKKQRSTTLAPTKTKSKPAAKRMANQRENGSTSETKPTNRPNKPTNQQTNPSPTNKPTASPTNARPTPRPGPALGSTEALEAASTSRSGQRLARHLRCAKPSSEREARGVRNRPSHLGLELLSIRLAGICIYIYIYVYRSRCGSWGVTIYTYTYIYIYVFDDIHRPTGSTRVSRGWDEKYRNLCASACQSNNLRPLAH